MFKVRMLAVIFCFCVVSSSLAFNLTILHFNDIDSQLESFQKGTDPPQQGNTGGGIARLITEIKKWEAFQDPDNQFLRIATANLVGGQNGWLSTLHWPVFGELVKSVYEPDIMGLGLREFESDLSRTNAYLESASIFPVVVSNIDKTTCNLGGSERIFCNFTVTHKILNFNGIKVGFVGFVNPTAMQLSDPGQLKFLSIPGALEEAIKHSDFNDVKTIIAIGSGSMSIARNIIDEVQSPKLKLVIYAGIARNMTGEFPLEYKDKFIATGLKFGQGLGKIVLNFDGNSGEGKVDKQSSELIMIGEQLEDSTTTNIVEGLKHIVVGETEEIGKTLVKLKGSRDTCWYSECNLGNLVTDAMVYCAITKYSNSIAMAGVVAIWHSGAMLDDTVDSMHMITTLDLHKWLPFHNNAYLVSVKGSILKRMFATSGTALKVDQDQTIKDWGQYLQVSNGLEVKYTLNGDLVSLRTLHMNDSIPILEDVQSNKIYSLVIPSILYKGKSVYDYLPGSFEINQVGEDFVSLGFDDDCLDNYIRSMRILKIGFEERIFIVENELDPVTNPPPPTSISTTTTTTSTSTPPDCDCDCDTALTVFLTLLTFILITGLIVVAVFVIWPRIRQRNNSSFP